MEVDINEQKHSCIMPFEGSKEKQMIELNECWTLMMEFVIIWKTMTSDVKTVFGNILCYVSMWKTTLWSTNWIMGWKSIAAGKENTANN